ncbi:5-oxoprolinase subunit PxpB [Rhizobium sp. SL42]|uniref:5-oxoprolinase subunit PxpB n=1 Tax=Rhizobium sp. SL42 TaxID=2806346 RepID=UPI001F2CDBD2|nr:5-oxoprolinase subunit PxpB [Rhizobium sp. SL42]UJW74218.1 5-oxoprolinase subunit PxpB [Rhizobium sp. SL42]
MSQLHATAFASPGIVSTDSSALARISFMGARAFLVEAPGAFDLPGQRRIWALSRILAAREDVSEIIPGMTNLLVILNAIPEDPNSVVGDLQRSWRQASEVDLAGREIEIAVTYGGEHATDLPALCDLSGLTDREVVQIHSEGSYRVFALGSAPGFGYLHGLDPRIHMPRKTVPSLNMARGCVTIGGAQTGVAVLTGPNGWNSIGYAELTMFDPLAASPAVMAPGDIVRFRAERIEL